MNESENKGTSVPATPLTPAEPTQPVFPPIDATKAVPPVTPFPAWTWNTPVIPQFYWNVYSAEQRIRQICVEIGRIQAYLEYFAANANAAHWYLDNRFTQVETRLTARVDGLEKRLTEETARLDKALADETENRVNADKNLQAQIDTTKTALEAEIKAREAGDKTNADAIAKETADREAGDAALRADVDANKAAIAKETEDRKNGDAALRTDVDANTAAIAKETEDRKAGDTALRTDVDANKAAIAKETTDRKAGDEQLANDLATETNARGNADTALGGRIDAEATARQDADTHLSERITTEHTERTHDVQTLTTSMNRRPLATAITAKEGSGVTVESTESDESTGTKVVIGSTWEGDFASIRGDVQAEATARANADAALEAKLNSEIDERRHDDEVQNQQIAGKLAFGAVRAGDGITVVNDPDTTTATVSLAKHPISEGMLRAGEGVAVTRDADTKALTVTAEVTKAKLDEAIAGIPGYELRPATTDQLGGIKVGTGLNVAPDGTLSAVETPSGPTGLETVAHDDSMTGDGTASSPLGVAAATNGGLTVGTEEGAKGLAINAGDGLGLEGNTLKVKPATATELGGVKSGVGLYTDAAGQMNVQTGRGITVAVGGAIEANLGEGLDFDGDGKITATGAAGTSESVKVVYPTATQNALGVNNTSGNRSVGEFLNFFAGVDHTGLPVPKFEVKRLEITKKQLVDAMGRDFQTSDFETVNGGYFDGATAMKRNLSSILSTAFAPYSYKIASVVTVDYNVNDRGSMVINGDSILTYFSTSDKDSLVSTFNSIDDNRTVYVLYCVSAYSNVLDIYSRY